MTELGTEDARNGWTLESLRAYQREREKAFPVVAGNVVTEFKRPKAPIKIEGASMAYNPITRSFG
ncbi:hypothetical protein [Bradyrhizobium ottawaense]